MQEGEPFSYSKPKNEIFLNLLGSDVKKPYVLLCNDKTNKALLLAYKSKSQTSEKVRLRRDFSRLIASRIRQTELQSRPDKTVYKRRGDPVKVGTKGSSKGQPEKG